MTTHFALTVASSDPAALAALDAELRDVLTDAATMVRSVGTDADGGAVHRLEVRLGAPLGEPFQHDLANLMAVIMPLAHQWEPAAHWHLERRPGAAIDPPPAAPALSAQDRQYLDETFVYHPPVGDQRARYTAIRTMAYALAEVILSRCPSSRARSVALTNLETAVMWANASIARAH